jgi:monoamine oxidase
MEQIDVIVIGAGAAGLMAAMQLSRGGKRVLLLEANNRLGGRVHTLYNAPGAEYIELGAEFIHGDLKTTIAALNEAGIGYRPSGGQMWHVHDGIIKQEHHFIEDWEEFKDKLGQLQEDIPINDFLDKYFMGQQYDALKTSVRRYAAGYDTADPDRASSLALRKEWMEDNEGAQHHVNGGYMPLINYMAAEVGKCGGTITTNAIVKEIQWREGRVTVLTAECRTYSAAKCIITIPLGILQAGNEAKCGVSFSPALPHHMAALQSMGMGNVIKILFVFKEAFWKDNDLIHCAAGKMDNMAFLFSDQRIPTWWTQHPDADSTILTGWLGGPDAEKLKGTPDEELLTIAKASLAGIFSITVQDIDNMLVTAYIANWPADPYALGAYTYATVATNAALQLLNAPVANTLYFAGEAYYTDTVMGTVDAALASGKEVAERINGERYL